MFVRIARRLGLILAGALALFALAFGLLSFLLRNSLPDLRGERSFAALGSAVEIDRDGAGVPSVRAESLLDVDRALGFLHAQDRYFQMDLLRRSAAGELSALFGPLALDADRDLRRHRFRALARAAYDAERPDLRARVDAYVEGVRAGLDELGARPFEYWLLRQRPAPWQPEDCYLVLYAMYLDLQSTRNEIDLARATLRERMPELAEFLLVERTPWDAPLDGGVAEWPRPPRIGERGESNDGVRDEAPERGSNAFALGAARTRDGAALLASDMHLGLRLPNVWYRAHMIWPGAVAHGLTLPGAPGLVAGSNGHLAWSFTNSYADAVDWVRLSGEDALQSRDESITVAGAAPDTIRYFDSSFGPSRRGQRALAWVAHRPGGANLRLLDMMETRRLEDALDLLPRCGMPAQNVVIASADGRIAWTIAGRLPLREGCDGREPWDSRADCWRGLVDPDSIPRVVRDPAGQIWSANARPLFGPAGRWLGDASFSLGARATQIRDGLTPLQGATPQDLLAIQLDDRALFLAPWRDLLLEHLGAAGDPLREAVEDWGARASVESAGYRIVRDFRLRVRQQLLAAWLAPLESELDLADLPRQVEAAVVVALRERPERLLPAGYSDWDAFLDAVAAELRDDLPADPRSWTWGDANRLQMSHPLADAVGPLGRWLRVPELPLPGDAYMPRVQRPGFGASNRFVVSPGREAEGILQLPGGVSGHPLSPFFVAGHEHWTHGDAAPFLPGPAVTTLRLVP